MHLKVKGALSLSTRKTLTSTLLDSSCRRPAPTPRSSARVARVRGKPHGCSRMHHPAAAAAAAVNERLAQSHHYSVLVVARYNQSYLVAYLHALAGTLRWPFSCTRQAGDYRTSHHRLTSMAAAWQEERESESRRTIRNVRSTPFGPTREAWPGPSKSMNATHVPAGKNFSLSFFGSPTST